MKIRKATVNDIQISLMMAKSLKEWFNKDGIKNMKIDFAVNPLIVYKSKNKLVGFLCYSSEQGSIKINWMGVKREFQRRGVGKSLLNWLVNEAKRLKSKAILVETLPDEDKYEPYKRTRAFYYKNGFKRILYKKARVKDWDDQIVMEKKI